MSETPKNEENLREHYAKELAPIEWNELARFFASGVVIEVNPELDLLDTAVAMAMDDKLLFQKWIDEKKISRVEDGTAQTWFEENRKVLSVVVAPWVLVQELQTPEETPPSAP